MNLTTKQRERLIMTTLNREQTFEVLKGMVDKLIPGATWNVETETFDVEVYVDRTDELSEDQVNRVLQADDPMQAFYDELEDFYQQCNDHEFTENRIFLENNWDEEQYGELDFDDLINFLDEKVFIDFPYDHFLKSPVFVNLMVDAGDGNYDYTLNTFMNTYYHDEDEPIDEESGLLWLVRQQGYTKADLEQARQADKRTGNKFIDSVIIEGENITTAMNALTFFLRMTLEEAIQFKQEPKTVIIDPSTNCGLFDTWSGAGSVLEIQLEREFAIPADKIDFSIDGGRGYSMTSVYGMGHEFWKDSYVIAD
jgi:hypothetical protein